MAISESNVIHKKYVRDEKGKPISCYYYDNNYTSPVVWEKRYFEEWTNTSKEKEFFISRREIYGYNEHGNLIREYEIHDFESFDILTYNNNIEINDRYSIIECRQYFGHIRKSFLKEIILVETVPFYGKSFNKAKRVIEQYKFHSDTFDNVEKVMKFHYDKQDELNLVRIDTFKIKYSLVWLNKILRTLNHALVSTTGIRRHQFYLPILILDKPECQVDNLPNKKFNSKSQILEGVGSFERSFNEHFTLHETVIACPYLSGKAYNMKNFVSSPEQ